MAFLRITKTPQGHFIEEVYSGLQKSLRRGLVSEALYFAKEIGTDKYIHLLKKRLCMNILEDVGSISLSLQVFDSENKLEILSNLVFLIANAPKTHISAWINRCAIQKLVTSRQVSSEKISTLVNENREFDAVVRGMFFRAKGENHKIFEELEGICEVKTEKILKFFKFVNNSPLVWIAIILQKTRKEISGVIPLGDQNAARNIVVPSRIDPLPDWVYDKHTRIGKRMGRGYSHFFESSLIMNLQVFNSPEPYENEAKKLYLGSPKKSEQILKALSVKSVKFVSGGNIEKEVLGKRLHREDCEEDFTLKVQKRNDKLGNSQSNVKRIEEDFESFLQAQLITRKNSPKVYFCIRKTDQETMVVKGPDDKYIKNYMISQILKEKIEISHPSAYKQQYIGLNTDEIGQFLVSKCVGMESKYDPNNFEIKGKTLEKDVKISKNLVNHWQDQRLNSDILAKKCFLALAFRKCIGTNDTCDRNLLVHNKNEVVSIDDPALWKNTEFMWKKPLNKIRKEIYIKALKKVWTHIETELARWADCIKNLQDTRNALSEAGFLEENRLFFISQAENLRQSPTNWKW